MEVGAKGACVVTRGFLQEHISNDCTGIQASEIIQLAFDNATISPA